MYEPVVYQKLNIAEDISSSRLKFQELAASYWLMSPDSITKAVQIVNVPPKSNDAMESIVNMEDGYLVKVFFYKAIVSNFNSQIYKVTPNPDYKKALNAANAAHRSVQLTNCFKDIRRIHNYHLCIVSFDPSRVLKKHALSDFTCVMVAADVDIHTAVIPCHLYVIRPENVLSTLDYTINQVPRQYLVGFYANLPTSDNIDVFTFAFGTVMRLC